MATAGALIVTLTLTACWLHAYYVDYGCIHPKTGKKFQCGSNEMCNEKKEDGECTDADGECCAYDDQGRCPNNEGVLSSSKSSRMRGKV